MRRNTAVSRRVLILKVHAAHLLKRALGICYYSIRAVPNIIVNAIA